MGYYAGPAPEIDDEQWERVKEELQAIVDRAKAADKRIAFPMFGPARVVSAIVELLMSQTNTNKQTPRPNVLPPSQHIVRHATRIVYEGSSERVYYDIDDQGNKTLVSTTRAPATGPTQRLVCPRCGDVPPPNARYCIECGAAL